MKTENVKKEKQETKDKEIKLFSMMSIPFIILIVNGIDILNEMKISGFGDARAIDIFMLAMGVISLVFIAVNTIKWLKVRKDSTK